MGGGVGGVKQAVDPIVWVERCQDRVDGGQTRASCTQASVLV